MSYDLAVETTVTYMVNQPSPIAHCQFPYSQWDWSIMSQFTKERKCNSLSLWITKRKQFPVPHCASHTALLIYAVDWRYYTEGWRTWSKESLQRNIGVWWKAEQPKQHSVDYQWCAEELWVWDLYKYTVDRGLGAAAPQPFASSWSRII